MQPFKTGSSHVEHLLRRLAERARALAGADGAIVFSLERASISDQSAGGSELFARAGVGSLSGRGGRYAPPPGGLLDRCVRSRAVQRVGQLEAIPEVERPASEQVRAHSAFNVPVLDPDGRLIGVLALIAEREFAFDARCEEVIRELAESIGGLLLSAPGQGHDLLPPVVRKSSISLEPVQAPPPPSPSGVACESRARGRVLVVDDDAHVGRSLARILGGEHEVVVAGGGREALRLLVSRGAFDVVLCDVMMPEMNGAELFVEIGRTLPQLAGRVVFMSGGVFSQSARDVLDHLPNRRIEKPFDADRLRALVRDFVAR